MKTITFIRHAKSDRKQDVPDFERPLNDRGKNDAPLMGQVIKSDFILPDLIISSPANRAKTTARLIAAEIGYAEQEILYLENLYFADTETFLSIIRDMENNFESIYMISHNPGITYIVSRTSDTRLDHMPTCGVSQIKFDVSSWSDIEDKSGKLVRFDKPKNHKEK
ncbi:MAG: histidine phosphatase family protein [Candidatus Delongbacteria bacterium]|jgi:phosphohistidine phosphatase|nr:histidine phosphatase family protein [Candidatus Delongbacteria bacterium]